MTRNLPTLPPGALLLTAAGRRLVDEGRSLRVAVEGLRSRLPADLLGEDDPFNPDEEGLCAVRDEVRDLLMARLAEGGHDH